MIARYELPRAFESEELTGLLMALTPKQRRVLREYVEQVELGEQSVTGWLMSDDCPVTERSWYQTGSSAKFRNCPAFQAALEGYLRAAMRAGEAETTRAIVRAKRALRLGAPRAAERLVELVDEAEKHGDQVKAALGVLDRADLATASKGETALTVDMAKFEDALKRAYGDEDD